MKIPLLNSKKKENDEYYLQPPINQFFYRFMANMMSMYSVGDRQLWGYAKKTIFYEINSTVMTIFGPVCSISQFTFLYVNFSDLSFDTLGTIYSIMPVTALTIANIYCSKFKSYKRISRIFLQKVHLNNLYKEDNSEYVKQKVITLEKITRWTAFYLVFFFISNWVGWITIPVINNYKNKELVLNHTRRLQTSLYLWMPFDYGYNYQNWFIIHMINCYIVFVGVCCTMSFQCQNYMFVFHLIGHLHVLKNSLRTNFTTNMSDKEVHEKLGKIIEHHTFIIKVFEEIQDAFGFNVATIYMQNLLGNSIVLYQIMYGGRENIMMYLLIVFAYTGVPILMSLVLEEIRRESDDLPYVIYNIPWENMSTSNQKTVMLILQRSQELMIFKAFGGMHAGVRTMISILKTTFSYYVMLESSIEN